MIVLITSLFCLAIGAALVIAPHLPAQEFAFVADLNDRYDIYTLDIQRGITRNLTGNSDSSNNFWPTWSPDGRRMVYVAEHEGNSDLYVMDSNGQNRHRLTGDPGGEHQPNWSPDGRQIVFMGRQERGGKLYVISWDDAGEIGTPQQITRDDYDNAVPIWSPDGTYIAYVSVREGRYEIYITEAAHPTRAKRFSANSWDAYTMAWSPDGTQLALNTNARGNSEIIVLDIATGASPRNLTNHQGDDDGPAWSTEGILFESDRGGSRNIYWMQADGSHVRRLTALQFPDYAFSPAWRP